jgi:hypothetical protein
MPKEATTVANFNIPKTSDGIDGVLLFFVLLSSLSICSKTLRWPAWFTFILLNSAFVGFNYNPPVHRPRIAKRLTILAFLLVVSVTQAQSPQNISIQFRKAPSLHANSSVPNSLRNICVCFDQKKLDVSGSNSAAKITPSEENKGSWWTNSVSRRWWLDDDEMKEKIEESPYTIDSAAAGTEISGAETAAVTEDPSSEEVGGRGGRSLDTGDLVEPISLILSIISC